MITVVKILIIIALMLLLAYPIVPLPKPLQHLSPNYSLRYKDPHNKKNFLFIILTLAVYFVVYILFDLIGTLSNFISNIPILSTIVSATLNLFSSQVDFVLFAINILLVNVVLLYGYSLIKSLLKGGILDKIFKIKKKGKNKASDTTEGDKDTSKDKSKENEKENDDDNDRIPEFDHTEDESKKDNEAQNDPADTKKKRGLFSLLFKKKDKKQPSGDSSSDEETKVGENSNDEEMSFSDVLRFIFFRPFFEGNDYEYARGWVARTRLVLQFFVYIVLSVYAFFFLSVFISVLFPVPIEVYDFLINILHIGDWYIYPFVSVLFLQEICNFFNAPVLAKDAAKDKKDEKDTSEDTSSDDQVDLVALRREIYKRFDKEHHLRYYCESKKKKNSEYVCTNVEYASALDFIKKEMELMSGGVVQSYMECLDKIYNKNHVYFAASFYSELGEYLTAYTYIRLLAGTRMIFIVSDTAEKSTLKKHLSERLMRLTGSSPAATWRIDTADERLDQADILIASPSDFKDDNMVEQFPGFFDEVCNAIFIDADKMVAMDSYLCPIMAIRLQRATKNRIRFVFLTLDLFKGFASSTIPKFFCVDEVLSLSCANESEEISYTIWNKESKNHRIYSKRGQSLTAIESIIAELACEYGVDGVRLITNSPLDPADTKTFTEHGIEVNQLYRPVPKNNFMVYSDDRCNLSASLYACTRFRGKESSTVHIISKPYLLREYFMSKAIYENYINRSSFIQPRVTEHASRHKLSLLRIFCEATCDKGISVPSFDAKVKQAIYECVERNDYIESEFCRELIKEGNIEELKNKELAAYLIAGLYDDASCSAAASMAHRAKDFYIIIDPNIRNGYTLYEEKFIRFNKVKTIFDKLFACNRRVDLLINDENIGKLDTFPARTHLEYIPGQSLIYRNTEYEIEHISDDGGALFLRRKNAKSKNCLDTFHLRRYSIDSIDRIGATGTLHNTRSPLAEIQVSLNNARLTAETYGYYSLTTDRQTIDFYRGAEGNPHIENRHIRNYEQCKVMTVSLISRYECTDGMRLLISAVSNEFIRTLFPDAYRCMAIVPILAEPLPYTSENEPETEIDRIRSLYPYLQNATEGFIESDSKRMQFMFINDCSEDIGIIDWFYDKSARYMQEFLANIYSYLSWLKRNPDKRHYIYFGGTSLPECYDLDGCCNLLCELNWLLSDSGEGDYETAGEDPDEENNKLCSFCHLKMESGRYSKFDNNRYICAECFDVVSDQKRLDELLEKAKEYLSKEYPDIPFSSPCAKLDPVYNLLPGQELSEYYYRLDDELRTIFVERDDPETNVIVSLIRGIISFWQLDGELRISYANAQLYFEELKYLRSIGKNKSADWIYEALDPELRSYIDEISLYIDVGTSDEDADDEDDQQEDTDPSESDNEELEEQSDEPNGDSEQTSENTKTSFTFLREKAKELAEDIVDDEGEEGDDAVQLYDPNNVPRFWKRYLKNERIDDDKDEIIPDDKTIENDEEIEDTSVNDEEIEDTSENDEAVDDTQDDASQDDASQEDTSGENDEGSEPTEEEKKAKEPEKKRTKKEPEKKKKGSGGFFNWLFKRKKTASEEAEEANNPRIRFYNDLVRTYFSYSEDPVSRAGISDADIKRIHTYVLCDYPELFWADGTMKWDRNNFYPTLRCKDAYGRFDKKQVDKKRAQLRKGAKPFIRGISKRTDPYDAFITIYRRLILTLDYDGKGLDAGIDRDLSRDDALRSLYSALVEHKVVCAGYAVALQYLLQSVGIVCGFVISEINFAAGDCHAFNMIKLGKYVYYVDPTWGDYSNTKTGSKYKNSISYTYCCTPYKEFTLASGGSQIYHMPRKAYYPDLREMTYTNHEYCRLHGTYLTSYNKQQIAQAIAKAAIEYSPKEMGEFTVPFRCVNPSEARMIFGQLLNKDLHEVIACAVAEIGSKNKKAAKLLKNAQWRSFDNTAASVFHINAYTNKK